MAANDSDTTIIPGVSDEVITRLAQKAVTALATSSAIAPLLTKSETLQFVAIGTSVILWTVSFGWTYLSAKFTTMRLQNAVKAPAAIPVTK